MKKKMLFIILFVCFILSSVAYAHPPQSIQIVYDPSTKILTAIIEHNTNNPLKHYISKVDVRLNGNGIISQYISRQDNENLQRVSYYVPDAKTGDRLSVEGECSISGELKREITVQ